MPFTDPADVGLPADLEAPAPEAYPASIEDPTACDRFILREVHGIDLGARTPLPMRIRLARAGQRTVSLAVDVTNYLMLELGQPLHAFDRGRLSGPIVVRRARPGEQLETLDHVQRALDPEDILITDSSGPISLAGTMGGVATEVSEDSRDVVIEAAHFSARGTARMSRRHRLFSEASARFERGVDYELQLRAASRAGTMLATLGGGTLAPGRTVVREPIEPVIIQMAADYPDSVAGVVYGLEIVTARLREVGCTVRVVSGEHGEHEHARHDRSAQILEVTPPSWRPDLTDPADLAEEVIRLEGYQNIPVRPARATAGRGLTPSQRLRRSTGRALADFGYVEVLSTPFASAADFDRLQLPAQDPRRTTVRIANPLSDDEPLMRTTLLPGLLRVLGRNLGRGFTDVALFEMGLVFRPRPDQAPFAPILPVDRAPTVAEVADLEAALPDQPLRVAAVLAGDREPAGWWGAGTPAGWQDAIEAARVVLRTSRVPFEIRADQHEPWHPGRCAAIIAAAENGHEWLAGHAGELHPRVIAALGPPGADGSDGAGHDGHRDRRGLARAGAGPDPVGVSGRGAGCRADCGRVDPGRGRGAGAGGGRRGRGRPGARGPEPVRRLHRRPGGGGTQVARLHAAVPGTGPDAHGRGGERRQGRGGRRGGPAGRCRPARRVLDPRAKDRRRLACPVRTFRTGHANVGPARLPRALSRPEQASQTWCCGCAHGSDLVWRGSLLMLTYRNKPDFVALPTFMSERGIHDQVTAAQCCARPDGQRDRAGR